MRPLCLFTQSSHQQPWDSTCAHAFREIKNHIYNAPILRYPNQSEVYVVILKTTEFTVSASLLQFHENIKQFKPVYYRSQLLKGSELNYSPLKREFFALKEAFKDWRRLLLDTKLQIQVNANYNLSHYLQNPTSDLREIIQYINDFNCQINSYYEEEDDDWDNIFNNFDFYDFLPFSFSDSDVSISTDSDNSSNDSEDNENYDITYRDIRYHYKSDKYAQEVIKDIKKDTNYSGYAYHWIYRAGLLLRENNDEQIYIPPPLRHTVIHKKFKEYNGENLSCNKLYDILSENYWWPGLKQDIKEYYAKHDHSKPFQKNPV
ncbi:hypothetical protein PIROE2DRAFT_64164 [Piromyces sp. E2]|nr:hypothetical protein PIROE2DRAFT_64164 [Piromyces sp. E2]|eukprot:OUM58827.1 hypothetical protein PIROE2DRAFT_64164 [Piromyces sp. E2]